MLELFLRTVSRSYSSFQPVSKSFGYILGHQWYFTALTQHEICNLLELIEIELEKMGFLHIILKEDFF